MEAQGITLDFSVELTWSNATFATYFCGNLSYYNTNLSIVNIYAYPEAMFVIPDCAFNYLITVSNIRWNYAILVGNSTYPDPLVRLSKALTPSTQTASITLLFNYGRLLSPNGSPYSPDWKAIFEAFPSLMLFSLGGVYIGPTTLPTLPTTLAYFDVSDCGIIATLPDTLLNQSVTAISLFKVIQYDMSENQIYGTIPVNFLAVAGPVTELSFSLRSNNLTGPIPNLFGSKPWPSVDTSLQLDFSANKLSGPLPGPLLPPNSFPNVQRVFIDFSKNVITGTIPANFIQDALSLAYSLDIELQQNQLSGGLPSGLFLLNTTTGGVSASIESFKFLAYSNKLNGTIASDLFTALNWTQMRSVVFQVSDNMLIGDLPTAFIGSGNAPFLYSLEFQVSQNPTLNGSVPSTLLSSLAGLPSPAPSVQLTVSYDSQETNLTGAFHVPGFPSRSAPVKLQIQAQQAQFTSLTFDDAAFDAIYILAVESNPHMTGTLPSSIFNASSILQYLSASSTSLSGMLPDLGTLQPPKLTGLILDHTDIDVCSGARAYWNMTSPDLECTLPNSFITGSCANLYPTLCADQVPTPEPVGCALSSRPDASWVCVGGRWTYEGFFPNATIVIPSGSASTVISGGLNSSTIIFQGIGGSLTITDGCAEQLTSIVVELSPSQLSALNTKTPYTLLSYPDTCALPSLTVAARTSGCKRVHVKTISSSGTLSALFNIDSSKCNTWWIILVSVVCGVIVLTAIILALVISLVPSARNKILPFRQRSITRARVTQT